MTRFTEVADCRDYKPSRRNARPVVTFVMRVVAVALAAVVLGIVGGMSWAS